MLLELALTESVWLSFGAPEVIPVRLTLTLVLPEVVAFCVTSLMGSSVGGSFTGLTVRTNELAAVAEPSLTVSVIIVVPNWFVAGTMVAMRIVPLPSNKTLAFGTKVVLVELAVTVNRNGGVSTSATMNGMVTGVSSLVVWLATAEIVGGASTALTVTVKLRVTTLFERPPSFTVTVIVAVPVALVTGLNVNVPVPFGLV